MGDSHQSFETIQDLSKFLDLIHKTLENVEGEGFVIYDILDDSYLEDGGEIYFNKDQLVDLLSDLGEHLCNVVVYGVTESGIDCTNTLFSGAVVVDALTLVLSNLEDMVAKRAEREVQTKRTGSTGPL